MVGNIDEAVEKAKGLGDEEDEDEEDDSGSEDDSENGEEG
jgi:hypothetical protein